MPNEKDYTVYKFYKGETQDNCPFNDGTHEATFWFYESHFERLWNEYESCDWYDFFGNKGDRFMALLTPEDHDYPSDKKGVFALWLEYLFTEKYVCTDEVKNWYFSSGTQKAE